MAYPTSKVVQGAGGQGGGGSQGSVTSQAASSNSYGRVIDVILDDKHPLYKKYGGGIAINGVVYKRLTVNTSTEVKEKLNFAYQPNANIKIIPVVGEIVEIETTVAPGGSHGKDNKKRRFYSKIINLWNNPNSGIFLDLEPDEEEKAQLEQNIQVALQSGGIDLEDAIDLREIKNIKLANQLLKIRRKKKQERDQLMQQQNIQAQAQANQQSAQAAAQGEMQKEQAKAQSTLTVEQTKAQIEAQRMQQEVAYKKELMQMEFETNMQLKEMDQQTLQGKEAQKEDRKDQRTRIQASQQSELIDQRKTDKPPKNFESAGNDTLGGDFNLGGFDPR